MGGFITTGVLFIVALKSRGEFLTVAGVTGVVGRGKARGEAVETDALSGDNRPGDIARGRDGLSAYIAGAMSPLVDDIAMEELAPISASGDISV